MRNSAKRPSIVVMYSKYFVGSLASLGILLACAEAFEPFAVGHWESVAVLEDSQWNADKKGDLILDFYSDGSMSLNSIKGVWTITDINRGIIKIEMPKSRYQTTIIELTLLLSQEEPAGYLAGRMIYEGVTYKVKQQELRGVVGAIRDVIEKAAAEEAAETRDPEASEESERR